MPEHPRTSGPDDEQAFLAAYDAARFPRPSVAVDLALVTVAEGTLRALLIRRDDHPGKGRWALPRGVRRAGRVAGRSGGARAATEGGPRRRLHGAALHLR